MSVSITISGKDVLAWITVGGCLVLRAQGIDGYLELLMVGIIGAYYGVTYFTVPASSRK